MPGQITIDGVGNEYEQLLTNVTGLTWAWWSPGNSVDGSAPVDSGTDGVINADGQMVINVNPAGMGDLAVTDGTNFAVYVDVTAV